jgi:hypothetical protein
MIAFDVNTKNFVTVNPGLAVIGVIETTDTIADVTTKVYQCGHEETRKDISEYHNTYVVFGDGSTKCTYNPYEYRYYSFGAINRLPDVEEFSLFPKRIRENLPCDEYREEEIIQEIEDVCPGCKRAKTLGDLIVTHGVSAFNRADSFEEIYSRLLKMNFAKELYPEAEFCCCSEGTYIGPIGIAVKGNITAYFETDVYSYILENGKRGWCNEHKSDHDEYWVTAPEIQYLWVKEWYWETLDKGQRQMLAFIVSNCYKTNLIKLVSGRHED